MDISVNHKLVVDTNKTITKELNELNETVSVSLAVEIDEVKDEMEADVSELNQRIDDIEESVQSCSTDSDCDSDRLLCYDGWCSYGVCREDNQCPENYPNCLSGFCLRCYANEECSGEDNLCDSVGRCRDYETHEAI